MLRKETKPYLALTYYVKDVQSVITGLEKKNIQFEMKPKKTDPVKRWLIRSPDGLAVSIVNIIEGFAQPPGPGMLQMDQKDYFDHAKYVNKTCGLFGELAHPVKDLGKSLAWWELLGFRALSTFTSPYPWAIISDGLSIVGLHQSDHFSYPAITYFAADMPVKIAALKKAGLSGFTKKGPGEEVLTTPEDQHIFLFNLGGGSADIEEKTKPALNPDIIETKRLLLKIVTPEIHDQLFTTCSEEEIMDFLGLTGPEEFHQEQIKWQQGMTTYRISFRLFLIVNKDSGKVIGKCGLHNWYAQHHRAEIGYNMTDENMKRKGFMKETVAAVINFGFKELGLNRIEAFTSLANIASQKVLIGAGFTKECILRSRFCLEGVMVDDVCYALLKNEYTG